MQDRLRELVAINRAIVSSLDYDQVLKLVVDKTADFTEADSCALLLQGEDGLARVVAFSGIDEERVRDFEAPLDERINAALRELLTFQEADVFLGAPVINHGAVRGLLVVYRHGPEAQDTIKDEEFLVSALADQAAIALEHASKFAEIRRLSEHKSRLLETVQSNTASYLAYLDPSLRFIEANRAYCDAIGRSREEIIGQLHWQVWPDRQLLPLLERVRDEATSVELREATRSVARSTPGECAYWDISARAVLRADGSVEGIVVSAVDVTERVLAQRELEVASRRKDEFLAMLAHELRNPLAAIASAVEVLELKMPRDPMLTRACDAAGRQALHMKRLLDDLLDVSRITRGKITLERSLTNMAEVVHQAVQASRPMIEANRQQLSVALPEERILVDGDRERLVQVLSNLLSNAAKFSEPEGRIWLSVQREDSELKLQVRDEGTGISPDIVGSIFELFVQSERGLDRLQGGLGIGLTLVQRLVQMHGGRVTAHSAGAGQGSEFTVWLPTVDAEHRA